MRPLAHLARTITDHWLAVSVSRDANVDADRLSHPTNYSTVANEAEAVGLHVLRAHIHDSMWQWLVDAALIGVNPRPAKKRRPRPEHRLPL
jgi:hypothetical protein